MSLDKGGTLRILSSSDVDSIVRTLSLSSLLYSQALAFRSTSSSSDCPPRLSLSTPLYTQLFMPARNPSASPDSVIKCVSVPREGRGIPAVNLLFDDDTGRVTHVVNSSKLTPLRTAAGSVLSSILNLWRDEVDKVVVFGDGAQALYHLWLHQRYFTSIQNVCVVVGSHWKLSAAELAGKQDRFIKALAELMQDEGLGGMKVEFLNGVKGAREEVNDKVAEPSLVICCTPSTHTLFDWSSNSPHAQHFVGVGSYKPHMRELPGTLLKYAASSRTLLVDDEERCGEEAGCLLQGLTPEGTGGVGRPVGRFGRGTPGVRRGGGIYRAGRGGEERVEQVSWKWEEECIQERRRGRTGC